MMVLLQTPDDVETKIQIKPVARPPVQQRHGLQNGGSGEPLPRRAEDVRPVRCKKGVGAKLSALFYGRQNGIVPRRVAVVQKAEQHI